MEKGSFHATDEFVQNIALPNELPQGLDFGEIPPNMLKSSTFEGVISQNEDLMARLSVSLRKMAQMEEQIAQLEKENRGIKNRFQTIREQQMVLQEKDRFSSTRAVQLFEESADLKDKITRLEKSYADLYVKAQAFQKRMVQLERYRAHIRKLAPAMQARSKRLPAIEKELATIRQETAQRHHQLQISYEARLQEARTELASLQSKVQDRNQVFAEKVELENRLVGLERKFNSYREDSEHENHRLFTDNASLRSQLKDNLVIQASLKKTVEELSEEVPDLQDAKQALIEQVESLQTLWSHKQRDLEAIEEKNRSLQKLNQSLGQTLNQQRKELSQKQIEMENERFEASEKIKTLLTEIQLLRQNQADSN